MGDRPIECGRCKKPVCVLYKEIVNQVTTCTEMCLSCPVLSLKLQGDVPSKELSAQDQALGCSNCGTLFQSVKMGEPLGCTQCYAIFSQALVTDLLESEAVSPSARKKMGANKSENIHIGNAPDHEQTTSLSNQLSSLNESLNEALRQENYEQAALLRDQIKALTDHQDGTKT